MPCYTKLVKLFYVNGMLVPVRSRVGLRQRNGGTQIASGKVDVSTLNAVKNVLADEGLTLETSANTFFTAFSISTSTLR